ncbi:patatin-like phospholipase family protein [Sulfitobacter sp. M13]
MTDASTQTSVQHKSFALVFSGGGGRGLSHVGVLKALNSWGHFPNAIVGVSKGAVVGATYALNPNWYRDLVEMDTSGFPSTPNFQGQRLTERVRGLTIALLAARDMYFGWGAGARTESWGRGVLSSLTKGKNLEEGRIPFFACATDVLSGERVVHSRGSAADYVYASAALAGILPPLIDGPHVLMDGVYADIAPIDVARSTGVDVVIAVDPSQPETKVAPRNWVQAMLRSVEICQNEHARLRFSQADMVIRPKFRNSIGTLEFRSKRHCIASGVMAVRRSGVQFRSLLLQDV